MEIRRLWPLLSLAALLAVAGCGGRTAAQKSVPRATPTVTPTATPTPTFSDLIASLRSGVIRIESELCDGQAVGTGFLISRHLVLTVEHVVDGATNVTLKQGKHVAASGTVIGEDADRDIALVRSSRRLSGHVFALARTKARLGDAVAALGFPLGLPLTVTRGSVSGTGRSIPIEGMTRRGLVQTDAAVNPGNSGGPLLRADTGEVVGLVDLGSETANGLAFAVSAKVAQPLAEAWRVSPQPVAVATCEGAPPDVEADAPAEGSAAPARYEGAAFSIDYPSSWDVTASEKPTAYGTDTSIEDPSDPGALIRVDVTPGVEDLQSFAAPVVRALQRGPSYQELDLSDDTFQGYTALSWEFLVREHGTLLHKHDEMFIDDAGDGVAILTQAAAADYDGLTPSLDAAEASYLEH